MPRNFHPATRGSLAAALALAAVMTAPSGAAASNPDSAPHTPRLRLGVPAYWPADYPAGAAMFTRLVSAIPPVDLVVVNGPDSAPPSPFDPATAATVDSLHSEGATVLGYVDSGYLGSTSNRTTRVNPGSTALNDWVGQIRHDIDEWYRLYGAAGLDGVFLDQIPSVCGQDEAYPRAYRRALRTLWQLPTEAMVAMNPGTNADECYTEVADALVLFENTYAAYLEWSPPAWVNDHPETEIWNLVYDVPADAAGDALRLARERGANYVYVTDHSPASAGSPWHALPTYWDAELRLVAGDCGTD